MKTIDSDLKSKSFKHLYLLFGEESFMVRSYKKALTEALMPDQESMNFTKYDSENFDEAGMTETCNTMPFFADHRLILVEDSGVFNRSSDVLSEFFEHIPDSAYIVFAESKADKRKALFKKAQKYGVCEEFKSIDEKSCSNWIIRRVRAAGLNMTKTAWKSFYARTGESMENMSNEIDKLISYCHGRETITEADVDAICITWIEGRIFDMINAIAKKNAAEAVSLYRNMLLLKESPMRILIVMRDQFVKILKIKEMSQKRMSDDMIAKEVKLPSFAVSRNRSMASNFTTEELRCLISDATDLEGRIKLGLIKDNLGLEILFMKYA